jgi:hypothetical protein
MTADFREEKQSTELSQNAAVLQTAILFIILGLP